MTRNPIRLREQFRKLAIEVFPDDPPALLDRYIGEMQGEGECLAYWMIFAPDEALADYKVWRTLTQDGDPGAAEEAYRRFLEDIELRNDIDELRDCSVFIDKSIRMR
jgi:hypothetical protein